LVRDVYTRSLQKAEQQMTVWLLHAVVIHITALLLSTTAFSSCGD